MNNRRKLVIAIGAGALAGPLRSFAQQQSKIWRVGVLSARRSPASLELDYYGAFPRRMSELGYIEAKNLIIEWRFANGDYEVLPRMAAELLKLKPDVILALGPPGAFAAQRATTTIPIVFVVSADPVAAGLVKSLAQPGGNITGLSNLAADLSPKHLEMLVTFVPKLSRVAIMLNPANSAHATALEDVKQAAQKSGIKAVSVTAQTPDEIETAFSTMVRYKAGAVIVALDPLFIQQVPQIAGLATTHRLPSIFPNREYAEAGGLMSYGQNQIDIYRRAADYVDRIFKGGKPGDLPVEQPTKLELLINSKAAQTLGLTIPPSLRIRADKVIE